MNSEGRGVHKRFKNVQRSNHCFVTVLFRMAQNYKDHTHEATQLNDWPVKLERDRCVLQMINTRSYSPTYDLRSSCLYPEDLMPNLGRPHKMFRFPSPSLS